MIASDPLAQHAMSFFRSTYAADAQVIVAAPGRVNLIGEHTDYNDGFVLPMTIDRRTILAVRRRSDATARLRTEGFNDEAVIDLSKAISKGLPEWSNYVRGSLAFSQEAGWTSRASMPSS